MLKKRLWSWIGILFVFGAPNVALADCPDAAVTCGELSIGWQGRCFKAPVACAPCGPKHCPGLVGLQHNVAKAIPKHADGAKCRQFVQIKKVNGKGSACTEFPKDLQKVQNLTDRVFGRSACLEHDICYALRGVSRADCDTMFRKNMEANCKQFYFGHLGNRPAIAALNSAGYGSCLAAAKLFYDTVHHNGKAKFNPDHYKPDPYVAGNAFEKNCAAIPAGSKD